MATHDLIGINSSGSSLHLDEPDSRHGMRLLLGDRSIRGASYHTFINRDKLNPSEPETFQPYERDPETLARPWAIPGTPGLEHRIGGLEKADITGNVNYDPLNHEKMTKLRNEKIDRIANFIPEQEVYGDAEGDLLVLTWGSTYGAALTAVDKLRGSGASVSHAHLRYLNPFPKNLGDILQRFKQVLIPELNLGQLRLLIRGKYLVDAVGLSKVQGTPFKVTEIQTKCEELLGR